MFSRWHVRQILRTLVIILIVIVLSIMSVNNFSEYRPHLTSSCPDFSDVLKQIQELSRLQSEEGIKDCDLLREANLAAFGRMGVNLTRIIAHQKNAALPEQTVPKPEPTQFTNEDLPPNILLDPKLAPNNVFYVWCGRRWFEFEHYLSVKSVIRELRPDNIVFYYDFEPVMDSWTYNTWFSELKHEYPFFRTFHMNEDYSSQACKSHGQANLQFILDRLTEMGGMYVHESTLISHFSLEFRKASIVHGLNLTDLSGLLMAKRSLPGKTPLETFIKDPDTETHSFSCVSTERYLIMEEDPHCVYPGYKFFPKDIWELDTKFGRLVRRIFYGTPEIKLPPQNYDVLIPNIAHIVWIGGGDMDFLFYLGVLSLIYVAEVKTVFIHGDAPPRGPYWNRIRNHPQVVLVYRETPKTVYGTRVDVLSHVTDVWRVDFMVKYGGIYVDTDTIFVKPLDKDIRAYDAVGAYDWTYWNHPFPDTINFGVAIGKKNAKYWQMFQESMRWFMDNDWSWNGLRQPYRIKERHPELVKIDPSLQVICFQSLCHPTWWPDYHNESIHHLNSKSITNWRTDTYAFHWTLPTPVELQNPENLLLTNSIFSEIGQYVLTKAGVIEEFRKELALKRRKS